MKCSRAKERIILHLYGELSDSERRKLEQHMRGCPACAEDLAFTRDMFAMIDRAETPDVPEAAWDKCWGAIASGVRVPPRSKNAWSGVLRWAPAAAGVILIFALGLFIGRFWPSPQAPMAADTAATAELPQFTLQDHFDSLKPILAEYANRSGGSAEADAVLVDHRLIQSLLVQNYMLMRLVAQNDPQAADLLEDIDLVLREIKNMEAGDPEAPDMIRRLIHSRDIIFKINVLQNL